jgi:hypothetical protein
VQGVPVGKPDLDERAGGYPRIAASFLPFVMFVRGVLVHDTPEPDDYLIVAWKPGELCSTGAIVGGLDPFEGFRAQMTCFPEEANQ